MHFYTNLVAILSIMAVAGASPTALQVSNTAQLESGEHALEKREAHQANFYTQVGCSDGYINSIYNFNCGGHCYTFSDGVNSVYLQYSGNGNYPTADCYESSDCSGGVSTHNGIGSGTEACTNQKKVEHSCYLYYGC